MGGQRLHVVCAGNGAPTVLFESGIAASSELDARAARRGDVHARVRYDRAGLLEIRTRLTQRRAHA